MSDTHRVTTADTAVSRKQHSAGRRHRSRIEDAAQRRADWRRDTGPVRRTRTR